MKISRKSWAYKAANLMWSVDRRNMTLCTFFWSMIGAPIAAGFSLGLAYGILLPIVFFFGYRMMNDDEMDARDEMDDAPFVPISMLQTRSGFLIRPVYLALIAFAILIGWMAVTSSAALNVLTVVGFVTGVVVALSALYVGCIVLAQSSVGQATGAYLKAAKQKVCPFIEFTDE